MGAWAPAGTESQAQPAKRTDSVVKPEEREFIATTLKEMGQPSRAFFRIATWGLGLNRKRKLCLSKRSSRDVVLPTFAVLAPVSLALWWKSSEQCEIFFSETSSPLRWHQGPRLSRFLARDFRGVSSFLGPIDSEVWELTAGANGALQNVFFCSSTPTLPPSSLPQALPINRLANSQSTISCFQRNGHYIYQHLTCWKSAPTTSEMFIP